MTPGRKFPPRKQNRRENVNETIRARYPSYDQITRPAAWDLRRIQEQIVADDQTVLLEYSLGEQRSFLFALTSRSLRTYELPKRSDIESLARELHASVQKTSSRGGTSVARETGRSSYSVKAAALSRLLLEPLAAILGNKRLVIVADGSLQYVPFALLPEQRRRGAFERLPGEVQAAVLRWTDPRDQFGDRLAPTLPN